jgi:predicted chitinase
MEVTEFLLNYLEENFFYSSSSIYRNWSKKVSHYKKISVTIMKKTPDAE